MKILLGTYDLCGWLSLYHKEFTKLGHECDTIVKNETELFAPKRYTYHGRRFNFNFKFRNRRMAMAEELVNWVLTEGFYRLFVKFKLRKYDLVVYLWDTILPNYKDVALFKKNGAKIVFLFAGTEVRSFKLFAQKYDVSQWKFSPEWLEEDLTKKRKYISTAEHLGDQIYSVPDQAGLQTKPFYHISIPIDLEVFTFKNNHRKVPKVLHLPSDPWKKGTDIVEATVQELIDSGMKIEFFSLRNIKHDDMPALLQDMDILIDEIIFHGPGVLGFEAMASGCAVATKYLEPSPKCFQPPIWNINADNIKERLIELFENYDLQQDLIAQGRKYVQVHNDSTKLAREILENLDNPRQPDYLISKKKEIIVRDLKTVE